MLAIPRSFQPDFESVPRGPKAGAFGYVIVKPLRVELPLVNLSVSRPRCSRWETKRLLLLEALPSLESEKLAVWSRRVGLPFLTSLRRGSWVKRLRDLQKLGDRGCVREIS